MSDMPNEPIPTVLVGSDMQGDSCIYITDGAVNGPMATRYLDETQMSSIAHKLQELINKGEIQVDFSGDDEEEDDES